MDAEEVGSDTSARASGRPKLDDLCAPLPSGSRVSAAAEERGRGLCGKLAGRHRPRVRRHQVLVQTAFEVRGAARTSVTQPKTQSLELSRSPTRMGGEP